MGENGTGKSTLIKLLGRFYDPHEGRIMVDGVDLRHLDPAAWQSHMGLLFQDYVSYALSIRENIGFGCLSKMDNLDRLAAAAENAGIAQKIQRIPGGWDALLGLGYEGGHELSGGEWRRMALARMFFRDASLLVLDEPTAAMDARGEHDLMNRFRRLTAGKTTLLISHRLSAVKMADRIVVIDGGQVVEEGTHEELLEAKELYAQLFNRQAEPYR